MYRQVCRRRHPHQDNPNLKKSCRKIISSANINKSQTSTQLYAHNVKFQQKMYIFLMFILAYKCLNECGFKILFIIQKRFAAERLEASKRRRWWCQHTLRFWLDFWINFGKASKKFYFFLLNHIVMSKKTTMRIITINSVH